MTRWAIVGPIPGNVWRAVRSAVLTFTFFVDSAENREGNIPQNASDNMAAEIQFRKRKPGLTRFFIMNSYRQCCACLIWFLAGVPSFAQCDLSNERDEPATTC